ncbi:MAG TPA: nuclear transport factor 2 family protein [Solirubrobacteraceae bacterium]|nr:nuclear transport factor 2 family protein [Solirubrobacteraceae bacterium]
MTEPLDVVRATNDAFDAGDIGTALALVAEDVEWDNRGANAPGLDQVYHGHEGLMSLFGQLAEVFEEYAIRDREYEAAGDRVLVVSREFGRGGLSGAEQDRPLAILYTVRDGLIARASTHADVDEARRRFAGG